MPAPDDAETGDLPELLTTKQTRELLGISRTTLYDIIHEGSLTPVESTRATLKPARLHFRRADVERVLREGRRPKHADN